MQIDFYQLARDPVEKVVPLLAAKVLETGARLGIAAKDEALRERLSDALWSHAPPSFLANGMAQGAQAQRQPILLADDCSFPNGAEMVMLADGQWRPEAERFSRIFLLFDESATEAAREQWRAFAGREGIERRFFKQDDRGRWTLAG